MPSVSVVIPTYNRAELLPDAIRSVVDQTYRDFEIIVVDDGSTDATAEVVRRADRSVIYVRQENHGRSHARNQGIVRARGHYLVFLDSDDRLLPTALHDLATFLDRHPEVGVVFGDGERVDTIRKETWRISATRPDRTGRTWLEVFALGNVIDANHSAMVRRPWLDEIEYPYFDETLSAAEDHDLWIRLARSGCRFEEINRLVCEHRVHGDNTYSPTSPGFQRAVESLHSQRRKVFLSDYFLDLSVPIQEEFLIDWLLLRNYPTERQEEVFNSSRFAAVDRAIQSRILYYAGVDCLLEGPTGLAQSRLRSAARLAPGNVKYRVISVLADVRPSALKCFYLALRSAGARGR